MSRRQLAAAIAGAVAMYLLPFVLGTLQVRLVVEILYLGLFGVSFNLLFGYAGMASFGHSATFGVGGYALGLLVNAVPGFPLLAAIPAAAVAGGITGLVIGVFCVRRHGGYFALLTLAFSQFLYAVALKWRGLTGGDDGLNIQVPDVTVPGIGVLRTTETAHVYWLVLTVVLVCLLVTWHLTRTALGNALVLMRENEHRAAFVGYDVFATKLIAFTLATSVAAVAGALYATFQRLISPASLDLPLAAEAVFMAVLGGTGTFLGPMLGAAFYLLAQNWLSKTTEHWASVIGAIFVVMVMFAPTGLCGLGARLRRLRHPAPLVVEGAA